MSTTPIPPGPRLRPYIACNAAKAAIGFYQQVFGMELETCLTMPDGSVGHAELKLPDLWLYLSDEFPGMGVKSPATLGGTAVSLAIYVEDVDAVVETALKAGATQERETKNEFFGDRVAVIVDPFGHRWFLHTQIEEVSTPEKERRFAEMMKG